MNVGIGGDRAMNVFWLTIILPPPLSVQNVTVQWETKNVLTESPRDIADCILDESNIFRRKSNTVNIVICGLMLRDECWSVNRLMINKVNNILK